MRSKLFVRSGLCLIITATAAGSVEAPALAGAQTASITVTSAELSQQEARRLPGAMPSDQVQLVGDGAVGERDGQTAERAATVASATPSP